MKDILYRLSTHYNQRPPGVEINTLVLHSMFAPVQTGLELDLNACCEELGRWQVSAHFLIGRLGEIWQLVPPEQRAWHAGVSQMPAWAGSTDGVNDFSIGIELLATENSGFEEVQYLALAKLTNSLLNDFPLRYVVSHQEIALPAGRKVDPGPLFDWARFKSLLQSEAPASSFQRLTFGPQ